MQTYQWPKILYFHLILSNGYEDISLNPTLGLNLNWSRDYKVFPKCKANLVNSGNRINHWNIYWAQFEDPLCCLCLPSTDVASSSLSQEVSVSINLFEIQWKHLKKTQMNVISKYYLSVTNEMRVCRNCQWLFITGIFQYADLHYH